MRTKHQSRLPILAAVLTFGFWSGASGDIAAPPATESAAEAPAQVVAAMALRPTPVRKADEATRVHALNVLSDIPLTFIPNAEQTDPQVRYYGQRSGCAV